MRVHLVDGTYELFRAYYARPMAAAPDGRPLSAVNGLCRSLLSLLRRPEVTHVAIAFDTVIESFRNRLFAGYKTGDGIDPDLLTQFPLAEHAAAALGLVVWPMIEFEADDALATAAARAAHDHRVEHVVLCSPDKDFAQCVEGSRVVLWDRRRDVVYDQAGVRAKWGVEPASIPDWLALVGDSADGLPGIPRWGAKSAATVLARHTTIEAIPDDSSEWQVKPRGAARLAQSLRTHRREAALYKHLATLRRDVPLGESTDDLLWRGADRAQLAALCAATGDAALMDRVHRWRP